MRHAFLYLFALLWVIAAHAAADEVGCVSTVFKVLGPNDKICIESYSDPDVAGVVCHVSRARTGGMKGAVGLAEDTSDASIACRQVVRFHDKPSNTLVYLAYSDRLTEGSPQNSISTVPIMRWQ